MDIEKLFFFKVIHGTKVDNAKIIEVAPFMKDDFKFFLKEKKKIQSLENTYNYFTAYDLNVKDFLRKVVDYGIYLHENKGIGIPNEMYLDFSRYILNILGMFRSFLDFSDKSISSDFGKESLENKRWLELQSNYYDNYFEYRFMYKLRNFTQHVGFPPLKISYNSSINQDGIVLGIDFEKEALLEHKKIWKTELFKELEERNGNIKFIPLLEIFDSLIKELYSALFKLKLPNAFEASKAILNYRSKLKIEDEYSIYYGNILKKEKGAQISFSMLPEEKAKSILENYANIST